MGYLAKPHWQNVVSSAVSNIFVQSEPHTSRSDPQSHVFRPLPRHYDDGKTAANVCFFTGLSPAYTRSRRMRTNMLDRHLAAWLLTLPGPWSAASYADAMRQARRAFDASMADAEFEAALARAGYAVQYREGAFGIAPDLLHRDAA